MSYTLHFHQRGGDRSKAITHALSEKLVAEIVRAAFDAERMGLAFNLFATFHWEKAGLTDAQAAKATGRLIKLASDYVAKKGGWLPYAWVRENDAGDGSKGSHVHILLHCPPSLPLARQFKRWLRLITGCPYRDGVILTRRIGRTLNCYQTNPALYRENLNTVVGYVCKGAPQEILESYGISRLHENGGIIIGKRAARWQQRSPNLDKSDFPKTLQHRPIIIGN